METAIIAGDWVADGDGVYQPTFGIVKSVHADPHGSYLNLYVYDYQGNRIGRRSPAEGGPASFEPALPLERYRKIKPPKFPIERDMRQDWARALEFV